MVYHFQRIHVIAKIRGNHNLSEILREFKKFTSNEVIANPRQRDCFISKGFLSTWLCVELTS